MGEGARVAERRDRAARRGEVREGRGSTMVNMSSRQFLSGCRGSSGAALSENSQDVKKRKVEEKKLRRRFMNRGRNTGPVSWDQYFGGDLANLNSQFGGEDLEFKFLQSETTIACNAFDSLFSDEA